MNAKREWKPGDLAMTGSYVIFCHTPEDGRESEPRWIFDDGSGDVVSAEHLDDARPLVVIDPEDREQVERLIELWFEHSRRYFGAEQHPERMQAALREFANPTPPKPPADVTARVTDRRDNIWRLLADGEWVCVDGPDRGEYIEWDRLASERGPLEVQP